MIRRRSNELHQRQQGVALLLILFMLVAGVGVVLISGVDSDGLRIARDTADRKMLLRAKRALIDRAVLDRNRPGSLPCPDLDNDGVAELNPCAQAGRLPWRTIDLPDLRDSAGERLWYAMSARHRDAPGSEPLNSQVPGQLSLDAMDSIVALVIAPGTPLGAQTRRALNPNSVSQFLDGENADLDGDYTAAADADHNDVVLPISVAEIMGGVHKRVLQAAETLLREHVERFGFDSFIWLAPFENPSTSTFMARAGVTEGLVPRHVKGQSYTSSYEVNWSLTGPGVRLDAGPNTLSLVDLQNNAQTVAAGTCRDPAAVDLFDCAAAAAVQTARLPPGVAARHFEFNLPAFAGESTVNPPTARWVGSRDVSVRDVVFAASADWVIRITDRDTHGHRVGGGTIRFDNTTRGDLAVAGIHLAPVLDPDDARFSWYWNNAWHDLLYMAIAPGFAPGQSNDCTAGCLTLLHGRPPIDDKPALLLVAGAPLGGPRPSSRLRDYLDGDNATPGDATFAVGFVGPVFNDTVRIVAAP